MIPLKSKRKQYSVPSVRSEIILLEGRIWLLKMYTTNSKANTMKEENIVYKPKRK